MRTIRTAVAALAMAGAIGGAIAAGQTTTAPTVYIDNGTSNPIPVDLALKDAPQGTPGRWTCTETEQTPCYYSDFDEDTDMLSGPSAELGHYQLL